MGWRENGEFLRKRWQQAKSQAVQKITGEPPEFIEELLSAMQTRAPPGHVITLSCSDVTGLNPDFVNALQESSKKDMSPLAAYLTSEQPLGPLERARLARFLPKGQKMGRPQNRQLRGAAETAWLFYESLRRLNKKRGIKDRGHCDDMKNYAADAVVRDLFAYQGSESLSEDELVAFIGAVRELMEKPKQRRENSKDQPAIITFPISDAVLKNRQKS